MVGGGQQRGQATAAAAGSVLRARLAARRQAMAVPEVADRPAAPPPPSFDRLVATATARACSRASDLVAAVEAIDGRGLTLGDLPELLPERALIAVVEAAGDRLGVVALCPATLAALIEMQAIGRVTSRQVEARRPTRADAALAAEFVNHLLDEIAQAVSPLGGQEALQGWRYASYLDDPRPLGLMLEDGAFRGLRLSLRYGPAAERRGSILLALPAPVAVAAAPEAEASAPVSASGATPPGAVPKAAQGVLSAAISTTPVTVVGVLCRKQVTLRELRRLQPGHLITLPRDALGGCTLETPGGQKLAAARLGERDGRHALRLLATDLPEAEIPAEDAPATAAEDEGAMGLPLSAPRGLDLDLATPDEFRANFDEGDAEVMPLNIVIS